MISNLGASQYPLKPLPDFSVKTQKTILTTEDRCGICGCGFRPDESILEMTGMPTYPPGPLTHVHIHYGCHMWRKIRQ